MSMADRRNAAKRLENLFNLSRPGHGDLVDPSLAATRGYPTKASDFEGQGWRRWVNASFQIARVYTNEFENDDGSVDKGITLTVKIIGDPMLEGDSCRLSFRGFQKASIWDNDEAEEDFFTRSDREQFEKLFDLFVAVDPSMKELEKKDYVDIADAIFSQAKEKLQDARFTGSVKIECYKPKADPEVVKGPYATLDRARPLDEDVAKKLGVDDDMPF